MKSFNHAVAQFKESIFTTMTKLANENQAINLSQGFPDFDGPDWVKNLAVQAIQEGRNQYAPSMGLLSLREAISELYAKHYKLNYQAASEIVVTNGATEALFCTCLALLNPGDEVIVFEPLYDSYLASIKMAGAVAVPVTLKLPEFSFDEDELKKAITSKTKMIVYNNPHNPTGKVFSENETKILEGLILKNDLYVISDEVYEHLSFSRKHRPLALLPSLKERTITISSTGKTFGLTGWKIGWAASSPEIIKAIHNVHQFSTFCVAHPLQEAMAVALKNSDQYLLDFQRDYQNKRDLLFEGLKKIGFDVIKPEGTYFIIAKLKEKETDIGFCKKLIVEKKVATIPVSAFYLKSDEGQKLIRFCFAKKDETLIKALENLKK
jgi:aspartate/methionine/tyrosine aminotransferase